VTPVPQSCESYVRTLASHQQLNATPDLQTILIGCGQPSVVPSYRDRTHARFPIYCDPDRALYAKLNMTCNLDGGAQKPKYITDSTLSTTLTPSPTSSNPASTSPPGGSTAETSAKTAGSGCSLTES